MRYLVNVEGVVVKNDQFLIIRRSQKEDYLPGFLTIPGGKVETGGNFSGVLEKNLKREILEETGVDVSDEMIYLESKIFPYLNEHAIDVVYLCTYKSGIPRPADLDEVDEVFWMTYAEIMDSQKIPQWTKQSVKLAAQILGLI